LNFHTKSVPSDTPTHSPHSLTLRTCPAQPHLQVRGTEGNQRQGHAGPTCRRRSSSLAQHSCKGRQSRPEPRQALRGVRHEAEAHRKVLRELRPPQRHCRARSERPVLQGQRPLCAGLHRGDVKKRRRITGFLAADGRTNSPEQFCTKQHHDVERQQRGRRHGRGSPQH